MTSWPSALINILLGSASAAYLGGMEWEKLFEYGESFRKLERLPEMRELQGGKKPAFSMCGTFFLAGELGKGRRALLHRERVSEAQPLADDR